MLNPKKKMDAKLLELLKTNDLCEATYNGIALETATGLIKADSLKNADIA